MSGNNGQAEEHQSMNVDNQTILQVKAGHLPPDALLQLLLEKVKPNAFGFSVQNIEDGKPDLSITREAVSKLSLDDLKMLFANSKDFDVTVYLAQLAKNFKSDDIQPFVIHDGDNNPFISIFLEGTLIGHDEPKEHTEHYNYVNGILIPKIVEWCDDFEGDLDRITKKLTGDTFNKEFIAHVGHRAVMSIIPCDGMPVNLGKNDLGGEPQDWGWVSQLHSYGDPVQEPEKIEAAPVAKKKFWGGSAKANPEGVHTVTDTSGKIVHDAGTSVKSQQATPAKAKESKAPDLAAKPPSWLHSNDDVKLWYDIVTGSIHPQWKKRLPGIVTDFEAVKIDNAMDFKAYAMKKKLETTGGKTETAAGNPPADTGKHDVKMISGAVGDKELPIIGAKDLDKVLEYVAKYIDGNSNVISDPKGMAAIEKELPNFASAVGMKTEETLNWPFAALIGLGTTDVRALALYAMMWRSVARPHVKAATVETKVTKLTDNTTKTESIDKTPTPAPKKTFWGGKAA